MSKSKVRGVGGRTPNQGGGSPEELAGRGRAYPLTLRLRVVEQAMSGAASLNKLSCRIPRHRLGSIFRPPKTNDWTENHFIVIFW